MKLGWYSSPNGCFKTEKARLHSKCPGSLPLVLSLRTTKIKFQEVYLEVVIMLSQRSLSGLPASRTRSPSSTNSLLPPTPMLAGYKMVWLQWQDPTDPSSKEGWECAWAVGRI